jgi:hypothetical protein
MTFRAVCEDFLGQAEQYRAHLEAQCELHGLAVALIVVMQHREVVELIEMTRLVIKGGVNEETWHRKVEAFTLGIKPLDQVLALGLQRYFELLYKEPALSKDDWQAYIAQNPALARRRYCHQGWLALHGISDVLLLTSIASYQQLTKRAPERFLERAQELTDLIIQPPKRFLERIRKLLEGKRRAELSAEALAAWLWRQATDKPFPTDEPYTQFAGPRALFVRSADSLWLTRESGLPHSDRAVQLLAIAIEEALVSPSSSAARSSSEHLALAPYPSEAEWRELWTADANAARQVFSRLSLASAKVGAFQPFNLGESQAAFRVVSRGRS